MPSANDFQGVILAAGKGKRIQPFSSQTPKPLLPVLDRPLIIWQIEAMSKLGIEEIVIVIGHLGHHIVRALGDGSRYGVRLEYVEQEHVLGIAHAVRQVEPNVDRPFLLFLGDIYFETGDLGSMLELYDRDGVDAVLAVKIERDEAAIRRNFTVDAGEDGFVHRVIEKPRHVRTNLKGCGLYLFDTTIFDAVRRTPRTALRDEYELTDSIQIFIDQGYGVLAAPIVQSDMNLSSPEDLLDLNLHVMREAGYERYLAEDAQIDGSATVRESVVMSGARIEADVQLERCLVLTGERVRAGSYRDAIFVGGEEIACKRP